MSFTTIAQTNSNGQTDVTSYVDNKYKVIVSKAGKKGISGWLFDVPKEQTLTHDAEMSMHYTEQGSFLNDTRVKKPDQIVLTGFIGELVFRKPQPGSIEYALQQATNKLGAVNAYLVPFTQGITQKIALITARASYVANQANAIIKRASNLVNYFSGNEAVLNAQQKAYLEIYSLWSTGQVVEVQTPWRFFPSMQILNIVARQDETTNDYTDFSITLQEYRTAGVMITAFNSDIFPASEEIQKQPATEQGKLQGKTENVSVLDKIFYQGK
jgi:hypothetical protein